MPTNRPLGMSRFGSCDSSAASGSSSMARYSHTANGMAANTPDQPKGKKSPSPFGSSTILPSGPTPTFSAQREKSTCGSALTKNTASTARAINVTTTGTLKDSATPQQFESTNTEYETAHQSGWSSGAVSKMPVRYEPMKKTMTA